MLLFCNNLGENWARERAKASDCSQPFLWGLLWGTMSEIVGVEKSPALEAHFGTIHQGNRERKADG
jgi:hypothetical protein